MKIKLLLVALAIVSAVAIISNVSQSKASFPDPNCKCENCQCNECKCTMDCSKDGKCTMDSSKDGKCTMDCSKDGKCGMKAEGKNCEMNKSNCEGKTSKCKNIKESNTNTSQGGRDSAKICPVSGETIEGEGVKFSYLGKEYTFCCDGCVGKFKSEPANYIKDEIMCPVMGEAADKNISAEYNGTKYYFCCESCVKKFNANAEKYINGKQ